jgi:hypothetical protein
MASGLIGARPFFVEGAALAEATAVLEIAREVLAGVTRETW